MEQYQDYEAGTYQSMTLEEKMDFFDGVHTNHIPLFDEDGDDMDTSDDYYAIRDEFLNHPEQFSLNDILVFFWNAGWFLLSAFIYGNDCKNHP